MVAMPTLLLLRHRRACPQSRWVGSIDLKLLENDLEDVRRWYRFFYVVGNSFRAHQVGNAYDVEILVDIILLSRGSNGDLKSGAV
jgi:hypothetical protein